MLIPKSYVSTNKKSVLSSRQILPHSSTPETSSRVTLASLCIAFQATNIEAAFLASGRRYFCNRGCRSVLRSSELASSVYHASSAYHASQDITHPRICQTTQKKRRCIATSLKKDNRPNDELFFKLWILWLRSISLAHITVSSELSVRFN